jgi:enamine deaminase RidA (YjgF/YER057c/UK114 family)
MEAKSMDKIKRLQPAAVFPVPGIKAAARVGDLLFLSGQVALDAAGEWVGVDDFQAQAEQIFANLGAVLDTCDSSYDQIVKLTAFFTDISRDLPTYRQVRDRYIAADHAPASSAVEVSKLFHPIALLEVEAVALCGPKTA